jgi:DNA helicase-2/ATP-dependent DNA helicase PcrA
MLELPRAEMEIVDLSESFGFGDSFAPDDHGSSFEEDWEAKSFLHRGKRTKSSGSKRMTADSFNKPNSKADRLEAEDSAAADIQDTPNDVIFQDFSDIRDDSPDAESPHGLDEISSKLAKLNKQLPYGGLKTAAQVAVATTMNGIPVDRFQEGDRVIHPTYGQGTIRSVEGKGLRRMARIVFADGQSKSFQLSKSKLDRS